MLIDNFGKRGYTLLTGRLKLTIAFYVWIQSRGREAEAHKLKSAGSKPEATKSFNRSLRNFESKNALRASQYMARSVCFRVVTHV